MRKCYFYMSFNGPNINTTNKLEIMFFKIPLLAITASILLCVPICGQNAPSPQTWRSALYPTDWTPGYTDAQGRFLHDFSYAGYHSGLKEIPHITENILDVTLPPYYADNKGGKDVTSILQQAINDAGKQGGGVVYLPAGEYVISVTGRHGLVVEHDGVVIRGAGKDKTYIKNVSGEMRGKTAIYFGKASGHWFRPTSDPVKLATDVLLPSTLVRVEDASKLQVGDKVVLYADCTREFIEELHAGNIWNTRMTGPTFCRTILSIDRQKNLVGIDVPTRYPLKMRDNARLYAIGKQLEECGIEELTIGNVQSFAPGHVYNEDEYQDKGTMGYDVHASHFIVFQYAMNCWARNINSYRPAENTDDVHILSNALRLTESQYITVAGCRFGFSQYEGGGGNGYMFTLEGNDCLLVDCYAEHSRHNYDFKRMCSNGNVIHNCTGKDGRYASDFHMHLSMSNLIDCTAMDADYWDASFRPWGNGHGYTTSQTVFWNTVGKKKHERVDFLIESKQAGWGYVIGTSGEMPKVDASPATGIKNKLMFDTTPEDFVEGEGKGESLQPQSLYLDQLEKRRDRSY